jgi:hypothetical protein
VIAGTLGLLRETADEPLDNHYDSGGRAVDVEASHSYLDGYRVQTGIIAGDVQTEREAVALSGSSIEVERRPTNKKAASEFVADIEHQGWILAERTWSTEEDHLPPWPFSDLQRLTGQEIVPMGLDPTEFVENQVDADRTTSVEMTTVESRDGTQISWRRADASQGRQANVGCALTVKWNSTFVRLCIYASGYLAIWEPEDMRPQELGRFVHEEIVPVAEPLADEDEAETEQTEVTA